VSKIDIIRRIANSKEGKKEIELPNEKIEVVREGDGYAFLYSNGYVVVPDAKLETVVIRTILSNTIPDDYKIEVTQAKDENGMCLIRCAVYSSRNHHTLAFAYGADQVEATGKCLLDILAMVKNKELTYVEYR
jgi:hypothetical protein